jgi:hypothetical protein
MDVGLHSCNPSIWEVEAGGSRVKANLGYIDRSCLKQNKSNYDLC